ncbi:MAG: COX15/CtaA family protein [Pseudomonadota bacterium]|nr:COX15/CtaA family protein [Pseudomonadota bacterium]
MPKPNTRPVAIWLFICCGMVFVTAVLGAITRLTGSGLSITDWKPLMGTLPPLNAAAWAKAFTAYQAIPQYQILNRGMTLAEFKEIYFWEWLHRFCDRLIGAVFAIPFIYFLWRGTIAPRLALKLAAIFFLGGLQGFVGWFMVESGLAVRTSVSPYRLALHLGLAVLLYALMLWAGLRLYSEKPKQTAVPSAVSASVASRLRISGWLVLALLSITMIWGAFVAGLHAGEAYNTWPLMEGEIIPGAAWTLRPTWINAFENLALVQFIHRWLGPLTLLAVLGWVSLRWRRATGTDRSWCASLGAMAFLQVGLGLATLLSHAEITLATLHQAGALTLLTLLLINLSRLPSKTLQR